MDGDSARNELRRSGREGQRPVDAGAQIKPRRTSRRVVRNSLAQPRVEDLDVEGLQTRESLTPRQHPGDMRDELAREHDLRCSGKLMHAVVVEKRECVDILADSFLREVRGE